MPQPKHLDPGPYAADSSVILDQAGGTVGALLIHGFSGSVAETRPMGEYLAERGLSVRCPLLPGHGTTVDELTRIRRQAWIDEVESALQALQSRCQIVFVAGLSMGSLLTLWLGAKHAEIAGLIPMAPAVRVMNRILPLTLGLRYLLKYVPAGLVEEEVLCDPEAHDRIWSYDAFPLWGTSEMYLLQREVRAVLSRVRQPVLIFQGRQDNWLSPEAAQFLHDSVASTDKTLVWLENSGHNLLADGERESVWAQSYDWMLRVAEEGRT